MHYQESVDHQYRPRYNNHIPESMRKNRGHSYLCIYAVLVDPENDYTQSRRRYRRWRSQLMSRFMHRPKDLVHHFRLLSVFRRSSSWPEGAPLLKPCCGESDSRFQPHVQTSAILARDCLKPATWSPKPSSSFKCESHVHSRRRKSLVVTKKADTLKAKSILHILAIAGPRDICLESQTFDRTEKPVSFENLMQHLA